MKKFVLVVFLIIIVLLLLIFMLVGKEKEYSSNLFYMDTYINVKIYSADARLANKALEHVEALYNDYHELTDRYDKNSEICNIRYNSLDDDYLKLDDRLYRLLEYGKSIYYDTNGLVNINMGNVIDIWKKYRDNGNGIPTTEELFNSGNTDINNIILVDGKILNNHSNIDLGAITKGYVTELAGEYLESIGIKKYIINAGGNVKVGNGYNKDYYNIGIESPLEDGGIYQIVKGSNISVVTSGSYNRFYEYNDVLYHHIIDPNTYMPPNYMKSVTVIARDSAFADGLSTALFLMPVEEGLKFIKNFNNVEAIWFIDSDNIIKSEGFDKYES